MTVDLVVILLEVMPVLLVLKTCPQCLGNDVIGLLRLIDANHTLLEGLKIEVRNPVAEPFRLRKRREVRRDLVHRLDVRLKALHPGNRINVPAMLAASLYACTMQTDMRPAYRQA